MISLAAEERVHIRAPSVLATSKERESELTRDSLCRTRFNHLSFLLLHLPISVSIYLSFIYISFFHSICSISLYISLNISLLGHVYAI